MNFHHLPAFRQETADNQEQFKQCPEKKEFSAWMRSFRRRLRLHEPTLISSNRLGNQIVSDTVNPAVEKAIPISRHRHITRQVAPEHR
jgi:uncharacterized protein YdiU (UPF0061 family)